MRFYNYILLTVGSLVLLSTTTIHGTPVKDLIVDSTGPIHSLTADDNEKTSYMTGKLAVVTGANRGIGLAFVKELLSRGYRVVGGVRTPEEAVDLHSLSSNNNIRVLPLDLESDASIDAFKQAIGEEPIDLLINNAGIRIGDSLDTFSSKSIEQQLRVNAVAPMLVSRILLPNLKASDGGSKIVMITSRKGSINENDAGGAYGYRSSKAALNCMAVSLSIDLKKTGIPVGIIHPGWIRTGMTNGSGDMEPEEAVTRMFKIIEEMSLENTGAFFHRDGQTLPW